MRVERVDAVDEDGNPTKVVKSTSRIDTSSLDGPSSIDGMASYRTLDGEHLTPSDDGFVGIETGRRFRLT